jgi:hypothetical protein
MENQLFVFTRTHSEEKGFFISGKGVSDDIRKIWVSDRVGKKLKGMKNLFKIDIWRKKICLTFCGFSSSSGKRFYITHEFEKHQYDKESNCYRIEEIEKL